VVVSCQTNGVKLLLFQCTKREHLADNHPISLTCVPCKRIERIIAKHIFAHLTENNLLSSARHGFISGRSTCSNLLESLNDWILAIEDKERVLVAYIDFRKAFECFR